MLKRIRWQLLTVALLFMILTASVGSVLAADTGLTPHYWNEYSLDQGTMWVNWDPNNPAPMLIGAQETPGGSFGPFAWVHYNQNAVNWIKANTNNQPWGHRKSAVVFHSEYDSSNPCTGNAAADWHSSNLPGARRQLRSHCPYHNEEIRIIADDPWSLNADWYSVQVMYIDNWTNTGNINLSSYYLDWNDLPWSGAPNGGRDYNGKICYSKAGWRQFNLYNC